MSNTQSESGSGSATTTDGDVLLELRDLRTHFTAEEGIARAVDGVNYAIKKGETLGVVGESGSGKSVTALSIMRLIPSPPGKIVGGEILFEGESLLAKTEAEMRDLRGFDISMIFQEPMTALNPVYTVGEQIAETVRLHEGLGDREAKARAIEMLEIVGIPSPVQRADEFPHQLSGGMRQRVMIAMAMACKPKLLIADEPTTALDVTIQAQILELIKGLQQREHMSVLLITHDLGVVAENADHVAVMYAGKVVEYGAVEDIFGAPRHPYTIGLLKSLPDLAAPGERLKTIPGIVPSAFNFPSGCRFRTRCSLASDACSADEPLLERIAGTDAEPHTVACHHLDEAAKL